MKAIISVIAFCFIAAGAVAQQGPSPRVKLDSVSALVISYLKARQADSVYSMTGKAFRDQLTREKFMEISSSQIFPLNDFSDVTFHSNSLGINKYRVEGTPPLQLLVSIDKDDKIETLLIQGFSE